MRIGLIGCGKQAPKHIAGLRSAGEIEIVVADRDPALARALAEREKVGWTEIVEAIFADPKVVAVDLCTPTPTHAALVRASIASGKDFFCEKPLCETADEARALLALADQSGRIGMVGYIYRFAPVFEQARQILDGTEKTGTSKVLGKIAVATLRIGGRGSAALWKHRRETGGGAVSEMLVHMLDLAIWNFGPITAAKVMMHELYRPRRVINGVEEAVDAEDFVLVQCRTESGVPVIIEADLLTPAFTQIMEVQGDNGTFVGSIQSDWPQFVFAIREAGGYSAGRTEIKAGPSNMFESQMSTFVGAVKNRRQPDRCSLRDSVHVLEALELMRA
ncbi:MAG TPA: Gfo/Idh/MocA family oxidoreductase [Dongiaceae bacterium]|jgi:predicted dehydrogenase|nr:Gfo/Idh/MocA family oxidoreductase [Dongiaceae bacterium]